MGYNGDSPNTFFHKANLFKPLLSRKQIKAQLQDDLLLFDQILVRKRDNFLNMSSNGIIDECWNLFKKDITDSYNRPPNINIYSRSEWLTNKTIAKISQLREDNNLNKELWKDVQKLLRSNKRRYIAKIAFEIDKDMKENRIYDAYIEIFL
ncbi:unnamed protein product [Gordionus sp. m RMFG-2023]